MLFPAHTEVRAADSAPAAQHPDLGIIVSIPDPMRHNHHHNGFVKRTKANLFAL